MLDLIRDLYPLKRDLISPDYDLALSHLAAQYPFQIHAYPSGTPVWTWVIPDGWVCHAAQLRTLEGKVLIDYADHPLHVVSYSLPYEGVVSRAELLAHLHTHPARPNAIPFVFKYYQRDWGLCCTEAVKESLTDEHYHLSIQSEFFPSSLKVGVWDIQGERDEWIILAAHLCHPAQANDDLAGLAVACEVMQHLSQQSGLGYSYRLIILPETIGSVAYLAHNESLIPKMVGGLFLEMLGTDIPHHLQLSHASNTPIDTCFSAVFRGQESAERIFPFLKLITNDERQFNAPSVRVPMLALARCLPYTQNPQVYPEYHSSDDTPAILSQDRLAKSRDLVLEMLHALEQDVYVWNHFKGEIMLSRYGLYISPEQDLALHQLLFELLFELDGTQRVSEIAQKLGASYQQVMTLLKPMLEQGLVTLEAQPRLT